MTVRIGEPGGSFVARGRPLTAWLLASIAILGGCGGDDTTSPADTRPFAPTTATTSPATETVPAGTVTTPARQVRPATLRDATRAVDADRYPVAERTFPALSSAQRKAVRGRIANRLARRARTALRAGNRSLVLSLLAQARRYPATKLTRSVSAQYRTAEARATRRDRQRLLDRQQRQRERTAKRRADRAAEQARRSPRPRDPY